MHNAEIYLFFYLCRQGPPVWHLCRHNTLESYHRVPGCVIMRFQWKMISYLVFLLRKGLITWQCDLWYPWLWLTRMWRHQPRSFLTFDTWMISPEYAAPQPSTSCLRVTWIKQNRSATRRFILNVTFVLSEPSLTHYGRVTPCRCSDIACDAM